MPIALSLPDEAAAQSEGDAQGASFPPIEHFRIKGIPPAAYYVPDFITADEEQYLLERIAETPRPKWKTVPSGRRLHYWGGNVTKKGVLIPETLPEFLTTFPDIIKRLETFIDFALRAAIPSPDNEHVLGVNQVLVNEYHAGQGISEPHEDGPAFKPLVATISLGSHTVLDIHHYLSATSPSPPMTASTPPDDEASGGRPIAAIPLAHLLLMPRSLLILSSSLYTSHLHGVTERESDTVSAQATGTEAEGEVIANADLLGDAEVQDKLRDGGVWTRPRGTRTSLTFRHANRVLKGGAFSMTGGRLQRV